MEWLLISIALCASAGGKYNDNPKICDFRAERLSTAEACESRRQALRHSQSAQVCVKVATPTE